MSDADRIFELAAELIASDDRAEFGGGARPEIAAVVNDPERLAEVAEGLREIGLEVEDLV